MGRQVLGQTGLETSRLGFGCVQLTTHRNRRKALAILEHAFAEGTTHFDVARAYGFGRSESILSKFLRGKRCQVTVATKFGLQPPSGLAGNRRIIDAAKKILSPFPSLLRSAKARGTAMVKSVGSYFRSTRWSAAGSKRFLCGDAQPTGQLGGVT